MNPEEAEAITVRLVAAGYNVDVTKHLDQPEETAYEIYASRTGDGESWGCLFIRDWGDWQALEVLFALAEQEEEQEEEQEQEPGTGGR